MDIAAEIERYLASGHSDPVARAWTGQSVLQRCRAARRDLRDALIAEVVRRAPVRPVAAPTDLATDALRRVEPMVRGLFPRSEVQRVLELLEAAVVVVTANNIVSILENETWDHAAWDLANLYLGSLGAPLLSGDAPAVVGISQEASCYVTPACFGEPDPFADYIVHEAAHIFHNCKREPLGLPFTRRKEWLLEIDFRKRETFAYSCEAFACVLRRSASAADRVALAEELSRSFSTSDETVDSAEVADIVCEAARRRNGWKVILGRCSAPGAGSGPSVSPI